MSFELRKIKEVGKVFTGKTPSKAVEDYFGGEIPFVTPTELDKEQFIFSAQQTLTEKGAEQIKLLPKNSVMFCCIGSLGKIGIAGCELATNQQINSVIFDNNKVDFKYGYYVLSRLKPLMETIAPLTTVPIINKSSFEQLEIPVPPLSTQTQIAQILDKSTALIAKRKAQIAELDKLVQSVFLEMFGDPVINTRNWNLVQLSTLGYLGRGGSKHRPRNDPKLLGGEYPFIQTGDIANSGLYLEEYKNTYSKKGFEQSKMWEKGTLCITIAANIAKTAILKFNSCFPDSVVGFIPNSHTNAIFINYWFSFFQRILEETAPESAQKNINLDILSKLNVICPDIKLQTQFAQIVEKIHAQKSLLQKSLAELEVQHQALMQKAFNGQLVG